MTIEDIVTKYWAQFTLFFLGVGYLIKRILDSKSKKQELNHNFFQQNRLQAVSDFFLAYAKADSLWQQIELYKILERKIAPSEIDSILITTLNELKKSVLMLQIYLTDKDIRSAERIYEGFMSLNKLLGELYFDDNKTVSIISKANSFHVYRVTVAEENTKLIANMCLMVKHAFKS